ncbi:MAG: hypothetical protein IT462_01915 [Planctomycetes bacterium]|nr:hypothetical protein [Planctomycetota bacterium]
MDAPADERELERISAQAWRIALSTGPCGREGFEEAASAIYRVCGHAPPEFLWLDGPVEASLLLLMSGPVLGNRGLIKRMAKRAGKRGSEFELDRYLGQLLKLLNAQCGYRLQTEFEDDVEELLGNSLLMSMDRVLFEGIGETLRKSVMRGRGPGQMDWNEPLAAVTEKLRQEIQSGFGRTLEFGLNQFLRVLCDEIGGGDVRALQDEGFYISSLSPIPLLFELLPAETRGKLAEVGAHLGRLCREGFWFWPGTRTCLCYERPREIRLDDERRLHAPDGPAVTFRDGCKLYFHHGIPVPEMVVMEPNLLTTAIIDRELNAEIRRVMIEIYGPGRYLNDSGAVVIDMDMIDVSRDQPLGAMPRALMEDRHGRKWLVGTDGSTKRVYYMRVPDEVRTCVQAHNALAGFDEGRIVASS